MKSSEIEVLQVFVAETCEERKEKLTELLGVFVQNSLEKGDSVKDESFFT